MENPTRKEESQKLQKRRQKAKSWISSQLLLLLVVQMIWNGKGSGRRALTCLLHLLLLTIITGDHISFSVFFHIFISRKVSQVWDDDHEVQELYRYTSFDRCAEIPKKLNSEIKLI